MGFVILVILGLAVYGIYWALRFIFARSFLLGLVFLFFGLPLILRLFFVSSFGFLAALLAFFSSFGPKKDSVEESDDGVIDVKGKIVK